MRKRSEKKARPQRSEREERELPPQREFTIDVPNDPRNEQTIIAAMMVDTDVCDRLLKLFPADAFYAEENRVIREGLAEMRRRKMTFDPAAFMRIAPNANLRTVEQLPIARPEVPANLDFHIETLQWDWRRAQVTRGPFSSLLDALQDPNESRERLRAISRQLADAFEGEHGSNKFRRDPKEVVREMMARITARIEGEAYFPFGIKGLDEYEDGTRRLRPGASPGTMTLVTALSGSGKSTLMAHLALAQARQKRRVLFGAWEETAPVTLELITTLSLKWSRSRVLDGKSNRVKLDGGEEWAPMTYEDKVLFEDTANRISPWIEFVDNPFQRNAVRSTRAPDNDEHLDIIQQLIEDSGCHVFFADLLARSMVDDSPSAEKHFLYRFLAICEACKVHGLAAHQQRAKDIEKRADPKPTREGIIGSGAWLDIFWTVLAPHLPSKWKNVPDNTFELYILKQRNGPWPIGVEFDWNGDTGQLWGGRSFDVKGSVETSDEVFGAPKTSGPRKKVAFGARARATG